MVGGTTAQERREEERALISTVLGRRSKAVVTGPAAARVLGLSTLHWVTRVDLLYTSRSHARVKSTSAQVVVHNAKLAEEDFITEDGVRRVSVFRTLFDSYRYYGRMETLVQIESARFKWPELKKNDSNRHRESKTLRIAYSAFYAAEMIRSINSKQC